MFPYCTSWAVFALPWYSLNFISQGMGYRGSRCYYMFQRWTSTMERFNRWVIHSSTWLIKLQLSRNTCFPCHFPSALRDKAALHSHQCYMMKSLFNTYPLHWNKEDWLKEAPSHGLEQTQWQLSEAQLMLILQNLWALRPAQLRVCSTGFHTGIKTHTCTSWNLSVESYLSLHF